jgi:uncharacterized lipoprotein YddW (UPF0748 family)
MGCGVPRVARLSLIIGLIAIVVMSLLPPSTYAQEEWAIPNGRFYTQTGGVAGRGYTVTDEGGIRFWSEFQRLGGVQAVGYPASQRFEWDGFTVQVFQRVVFQWRPEVGQVYFVNVFDRLDQLGHNDWLINVRQTPPPRTWDEAGLSWAQIVARRLAVMDAYPAIRSKYYAVVGDPIQANGLPTTDVVDMGNHYALRAQRVVFQQWKEDVPWARRGEVTVALGGDIAKETGVLPDPIALQPVRLPGSEIPISAPIGMTEQLRAYWVDAFQPGFKTRAEVDRLLQDVRASGANAVIVQVRRRGDAYFNNRVEPRTEDPALAANFDALQYLIERSRASDNPIQVHAWVAALPIWRGGWAPPRDPSHVFNRHGPHAQGGDNWIAWSASGAQMDGANYSLDPGHPAAADYTVHVINELVRAYDLDGIHLDYIRYSNKDWGYNPTSIARFNARYGRSGQPATTDPLWADWRREQVTSLVRRVYLGTTAIRPNVQVSAALIAWGRGPGQYGGWEGSPPYAWTYQDWRAWLAEGILDIGFLMTYYRDSEQAGRLSYDEWTSFGLANQGRRRLAVGPGTFVNTPADSAAQIRRVVDRGANSIVLYSYDGFARDKSVGRDALRDALVGGGSQPIDQAPFVQPARPPSLPWKSQRSEAHLSGRVIAAGGNAMDGAQVTITSGNFRRDLRADGSGVFGLVGVPAGTYQVTARAGGQTGAATVAVENGRVAQVEVRLGN